METIRLLESLVAEGPAGELAAEQRELAARWRLAAWEPAKIQLSRLLRCRLPEDLLEATLTQLDRWLASCGDPDRGLAGMVEWIVSAASPLSAAALLDRDPTSARQLMKAFASSDWLADQLLADRAAWELLRITGGQPVDRHAMLDELLAELDPLSDADRMAELLERFRTRESLRIAYGELVGRVPLELTLSQLTELAEVLLQAALEGAGRLLKRQLGAPRLEASGQEAAWAVIGLGRFGGAELDYGTRLPVLAVAQLKGRTDLLPGLSNHEFFDRLFAVAERLLAPAGEASAMLAVSGREAGPQTKAAPGKAAGEVVGDAYRGDSERGWRLAGGAAAAPIGPGGLDWDRCVCGDDSFVCSPKSLGHYFDVLAPPWQRLAWVKARVVAGDPVFGHRVLQQLRTSIFRRCLTPADLSALQAINHRLQTPSSEPADQQVPIGQEIEFVIQFLQLLVGADPQGVATTPSTLKTMAELTRLGCLSDQEFAILGDNYRWLRRLQHRLQLNGKPDSSGQLKLPESSRERRRLEQLMASHEESREWIPERDSGENVAERLLQRQLLNRRILNHLLQEASEEEGPAGIESRLVLDPPPDSQEAEQFLRQRGFRSPSTAFGQLQELATEPISMLSSQRCRHFLALIAPRLLTELGRVPDPDTALGNLVLVSRSLGARGTLWELLSGHQPSLKLLVRLCACSDYLVRILVDHPGMVDELVDSLMLDRLPTRSEMEQELSGLCQGAQDLPPILLGFKHAMHLRIGVRDILGKEGIDRIHRALADVAELILQRLVDEQWRQLTERHGLPWETSEASPEGRACGVTVLALGKLGGQQPNYHSDLDVLFLYASDGHTRSAAGRTRGGLISNRSLASQLAERVIQQATQRWPLGQLYELDTLVRPQLEQGMFAWSRPELLEFLKGGRAELWQRLALCQARPVWHCGPSADESAGLIFERLWGGAGRGVNVQAWRRQRELNQRGATSSNLKRAAGGTQEVEMAVQWLQLKHAAEHPSLRTPNTLAGLMALGEAGIIPVALASQLADNYRLLRSVESGLRLMNTPARHDLPDQPVWLSRLALLTGQPGGEQLKEACRTALETNRQAIQRITEGG
jgi:[glutamine synthetase] adenylyltransferase / [glutamine synthetase]-adenylyl-L-tyrosine phosphorylase